MKLWQAVTLIAAMSAIVPLSACEYPGFEYLYRGNQQSAHEEQLKIYQEYNEQMKAYREWQEEYREQIAEEYNKQMTEAYKKYSERLTDYFEGRQEAIVEAIAESANQTR